MLSVSNLLTLMQSLTDYVSVFISTAAAKLAFEQHQRQLLTDSQGRTSQQSEPSGKTDQAKPEIRCRYEPKLTQDNRFPRTTKHMKHSTLIVGTNPRDEPSGAAHSFERYV